MNQNKSVYLFKAAKTPLLILLTLALGMQVSISQPAPDVIRKKWLMFGDPSYLLYHHLAGEAFSLLETELESVRKLKSREAWLARQKQKKREIWKLLGGEFPGKTPLNPVITGIVRKEGFRVENLIFESLPGFYVTASLFIPDAAQTPAPAILFCSGHSTQAYRRDVYQVPLLNLVKKGFVVLAIDPLGQGERLQYYSPEEGKSVIGGSTHEHSYPTVQTFALGHSTARYFIWDGIRAIDYLIGREEVDSDRIGVHGLSGGGTQTAYIAALDDRVKAAAPAGYITGYKRLLESIGVQDGEQNFYHGLKHGIDHADFLEIRAPKPTLIMATTRDFFSIQGTRETYNRVLNVYSLFGKKSNLRLAEGDYEHGYTQNIREAMYGFFQEHLENPGNDREEAVELLTIEELQKTSSGQLISSLGGETVFSLNRKEAIPLVENLKRNRDNLKSYIPRVPLYARKHTGYREPGHLAEVVFTGRTQKKGYTVETYFLKGEGSYPIPYLLLRPEQSDNKIVLYLNPKGKTVDLDEGGDLEWLVRQGVTVLAPDLIGTGELVPDIEGDAVIKGESYNIWYTSVLIGRSILGIQASDIKRLTEAVKREIPGSTILALAKGEMGPVLLHAAAWDTSIKRIALVDSYSSYQSIVMNRFYDPKFVYSVVPGALKEYDLPDLAASLAPRKLLVAGLTDGNGRPFDAQEARKELASVQDYYRILGAEKQLSILPGLVEPQTRTVIASWISEDF